MEYKKKYIEYEYNYKNCAKPDFVAYTDGSCNNMSPYGEGGSAYVILKNGEIFKKMAKGFIRTTNNRMELLAIISAINSIPIGSSILLHTDSQYCILTVQAKKPMKNLDLIELFRRTCKGRKVRLSWVKGHDNNFYNEMCDALADEQTELIRQEYNIPLYGYCNSPKTNSLTSSTQKG